MEDTCKRWALARTDDYLRECRARLAEQVWYWYLVKFGL